MIIRSATIHSILLIDWNSLSTQGQLSLLNVRLELSDGGRQRNDPGLQPVRSRAQALRSAHGPLTMTTFNGCGARLIREREVETRTGLRQPCCNSWSTSRPTSTQQTDRSQMHMKKKFIHCSSSSSPHQLLNKPKNTHRHQDQMDRGQFLNEARTWPEHYATYH